MGQRRICTFGLSLLCLQSIIGRPCRAFTTLSRSRAFNLPTSGAAQQRQSHFMGSRMRFKSPVPARKSRKSTNSLTMNFLGNDGIFGVGAPEIAVTLLVGYFVLGPQDLYKLVKEIGKTLNTFREASAEATKQFNDSIESTIEIDELRKTQRELMNLNDAFSFRRSINVDEESDPFENKKVEGFADPRSGVVGGTAEQAAAGKSPERKKKRKKMRRVKKKKVEAESEEVSTGTANGNVEDLSMDDAFKTPEEQEEWEAEMTAIQNTRRERLEDSSAADWFTASEETVAEEVLSQQPKSSFEASEEQTRFASQLAGDWNEQILANEDKLSPLGKIMERLAILEEEKNAATMRLEEEFRLREDLEEKFYREKRNLLEEAAAEVQADAYANIDAEIGPEEEVGAEKDESKEDPPEEKKEEVVALNDEESDKKEEVVALKEEELEKEDEVVALNDEESDTKEEVVALKEEELEKQDEVVALNDEELEKEVEVVASNDEESDKKEEVVALKEEELEKEDEVVALKDEESEKKEEVVEKKENAPVAKN